MTTIEISDSDLTVSVHGIDRFLSLHSRLTVPLAHLKGAHPAVDEAREWYHGLHIGTHIPGIVTAGTFYQHGERVFWDVHDSGNAIAIELHDDRYARVIVEVERPADTIAQIEAAVRRSEHAGSV